MSDVDHSAERTSRRVLNFVGSMLAFSFLMAAVIIAWPQSLGGPFRLVVVSGTSMQPWLHTGDLVLAMKKESYTVGEPVVYTAHEDGAALGRVVHRIIAVNPDGTFVLQGDNKDYRDPWDVPQDWINGKVVLMIPKAYYVLSIWRHPIFLATMAGLFLTMALWPPDPMKKPPSGPRFNLAPPAPKPSRRRNPRIKATQ